MDLQDILSRVPDYQEFFTVDEMDQRTLELAREFPDVVKVSEVGRSRWGRPIHCLTIGSGSQNALIFGCPHPNEPIGAMMLDFLTRELAQNEALRKELDFTWYIVKTSDPDGTSLNEGWFKGPFTITNYARNFYRPAYAQQVEWSFPIEYKTLKFDAPIPETQALMKIIDEKRPAFIYSLHNSGFGGCYWYLSDGDEALYQQLYKTPASQGIPLSLGEPEMPYCVELYPAIYKSVGVIDHYDYLEKFMPGKDPADMLTSGTSSDEYASLHSPGPVRSLINEMPYFFDPRVDDTSPSGKSRLECQLECFEESEKVIALMARLYEKAKPFVTTWNPFFLAAEDRVKNNVDLSANKEWARSNPEFQKPATVAQEFDNLYISRFYLNLNMAILRRACVYEKEHAQSLTDEARRVLDEVERAAEERLAADSAFLEEHMNYSAIPIRKLVKIQAASGLIYAQYVHGKNQEPQKA